VGSGILKKKHILDHQPVQGKIDNNPEEGEKQCSSTSGVVYTLKAQVLEQMCDCEIILVVTDKKSKRPTRQPVTRNNDFYGQTSARTS